MNSSQSGLRAPAKCRRWGQLRVQVKAVRAVRDVGINRGATGPHFMECDDGLTYLVKFSKGSRAAVNEHLGHWLAHTAGLPTPPSALVEVSSEMIAHSNDLQNRAIEPGLHQGSEVVANASDLSQILNRQTSLDQELVNSEVLPGTVCLDNWILTQDRDRAENHLLQAVPGGFRYFMVDFTHSFTGPNWTVDSLEQGSFLRVPMPVLPEIAVLVRGPSSFESTLRRIEAVPDSVIEEIVAAIPGEWGITEEERSASASFIELRRGQVRSVLTSNRRAFPNWAD